MFITLQFTRFTPERQEQILAILSKPKETPSNLMILKLEQSLFVKGLAVPRLGNVQLRFHFLRRGTSGVSEFQKGVFIINVLDSEGKSYTTKLQR